MATAEIEVTTLFFHEVRVGTLKSLVLVLGDDRLLIFHPKWDLVCLLILIDVWLLWIVKEYVCGVTTEVSR